MVIVVIGGGSPSLENLCSSRPVVYYAGSPAHRDRTRVPGIFNVAEAVDSRQLAEDNYNHATDGMGRTSVGLQYLGTIPK